MNRDSLLILGGILVLGYLWYSRAHQTTSAGSVSPVGITPVRGTASGDSSTECGCR